MATTKDPTTEKENLDEPQEQEDEIQVAECNWVKGRSYAVKSFKKVLPPISHKRLPASGKLKITKIIPTSHRFGGYHVEACLVGDKTQEFTWIQFWWTTQDKFYYANFGSPRSDTPPSEVKKVRRKRSSK